MPFFGHKTRHEREWEEVRSSAQDDVVALGDDIRSLDVDIQMPGVSEEAILEGKPQPERKPPCFFDPRHGPSVEDVEWAPPNGAPRPVPACAADALRIKEGFQPHGRQVAVNGQQMDYWNAPRHYGPMMGGYFNGFGGGGLLNTLLMGSALGAGLGIGEDLVGGLFGDGDGDGGMFGDGDGDGDGDGGGWGDGDGGDGGFGDGGDGGFGDGGDFGGGDF
jgi:hypothetical protein